MINSKQHWGCRIQEPGTRGTHQTQKNASLVYQQGLQGAEFKTLGPVVENSRLFAQRTHSAGTAHGAPPLTCACQSTIKCTFQLVTHARDLLGKTKPQVGLHTLHSPSVHDECEQ